MAEPLGGTGCCATWVFRRQAFDGVEPINGLPDFDTFDTFDIFDIFDTFDTFNTFEFRQLRIPRHLLLLRHLPQLQSLPP